MDQLIKGYSVEMEHNTNNKLDVVKSKYDPLKIAIAHLQELPNYYSKLQKMENESLIKESAVSKREFDFANILFVFYDKKRVKGIIETEKAIGLKYFGWSAMGSRESDKMKWFPKGSIAIHLNNLETFNKKYYGEFQHVRHQKDNRVPCAILVIKEGSQYLIGMEDYKKELNSLSHYGFSVKKWVDLDYMKKAMRAVGMSGGILNENNNNNQLQMNIK